jgi:hypothetical protein
MNPTTRPTRTPSRIRGRPRLTGAAEAVVPSRAGAVAPSSGRWRRRPGRRRWSFPFGRRLLVGHERDPPFELAYEDERPVADSVTELTARPYPGREPGRTISPARSRAQILEREPRMEPRRARMRGVRAPHRRTAHTAHPL